MPNHHKLGYDWLIRRGKSRKTKTLSVTLSSFNEVVGLVRSFSIRRPKKDRDKTEITTLDENIGTCDTLNSQTENASSSDTVSSSISSSTDPHSMMDLIKV